MTQENYISLFMFGKFGVAVSQINLNVTSATPSLHHNVVYREIEAFIYLLICLESMHERARRRQGLKGHAYAEY